MSQFRSYAFTVRPLNGLSTSTEDALLKWLALQHHGFAAIEKESEERHMHGQVFYETPKSKGDLNKQLERICSRTIDNWSPAQTRVLRRGTKIAYSDDWIDTYLAKEDNIIFNNPPEESDEYYPSQEEQQATIAAASAVDKEFHRYSVDFESWIQEHPEHEDLFGKDRIRHFFVDKWFVQHEYRMPRKKIDKVQMVENFYLYYYKIKNIKNVMSEKDWDSHPKNLKDQINKLYPDQLVD